MKIRTNNNKQAEKSDRFDHVYNLYKNVLYTFILNELNDEAAAKDVFQDVSLKIYKKIKTAKTDNLKAWCFKIAVNTIHDSRRKNKRFTKLFTFFNGTEQEKKDDSFQEQVYSENEFIQTIISKLPAEQREVINMHYILGLSYREISELLNCSINTVTARARYGLSKLRKNLELQDYDPTSTK